MSAAAGYLTAIYVTNYSWLPARKETAHLYCEHKHELIARYSSGS